ncbi:A24 family peptidase [Pasteurellaceae bacterium TAE3-ERU1]|nr:A24 family peptidase [Pasteurellaceae bacterium TAE3-ERU1]
MMTALFIGAAAGLGLRYALARFPHSVNRTLQADCHALDATFTLLAESLLAPFPRWHWGLYLACGVLASVVCQWCSAPGLDYALNVTALWLLAHIVLTDWRYQLLSSQHCVLLAIIGLLKVRFGLGLTPAELCESVLLALVLSVVITSVSQWVYQRCAFGEGDCYLLCALACFTPSAEIPHLLLWASVLTLIVAGLVMWRQGRRVQTLPFAPGLVAGFAIVSCY